MGVQGHGVRRVGGEPHAQRGGPGDPAGHAVPAEGQPGPAVLVGQQCGDLEGRVQQRGVQHASGGVGVLRLRQHHLGEHLAAAEPRGTDAAEGGAVVVAGLGEALVEVAGVHGFGTGRRPAQQTGRGSGRVPGGPGCQGAGGVLGPGRVGVPCRTGEHAEPPPTVAVGCGHPEL